MTIQEIINKVENIESKTEYWFVRTNYGEHFDQFTKGSYVAIGWDYFTLDELEKNNESYIRKKIALQEKFDPNNSRDKIKITSAYNKIKIFLNLKKGDVVVVPSRNSDRLAFGKVIDDKAYEVEEQISLGSHFKRRKIEFEDIKNIRHLNPIFYQVKSNQHAVSNIKKYAPYIDKVMGNLFKKDDSTHYVLNIEKEENINFDDLRILMDNINTLMENINQELSFNENLEDFYVKINLQSKGTLELIKVGKCLSILAYLLCSASCNNLDNEKDTHIQTLINKNRIALDETSKAIDSLKINTNELIKPFK
jgi:restriction system protein